MKSLEALRRRFTEAATALQVAADESGVNELRAKAQGSPHAHQMHAYEVARAEEKLQPLVAARNRAFADLEAALAEDQRQQNAAVADQTRSLLNQARDEYRAAQEAIREGHSAMEKAAADYRRTLDHAISSAPVDADSPLRRDVLGLILHGRRVPPTVDQAKEAIQR